MKRFTILAVILAVFAFVGCNKTSGGDGDKIYYITTDGSKVDINEGGFDANVASNSYSGGIGTITFDGPILTVGEEAFASCKNLASITLPSNVQIIEKDAFTGCSSLSEVIFGNNVSRIDSYAFYGCSALLEVVIPSRVSIIGDHAFANCTSLTRVDASDELLVIGSSAFYNCGAMVEFNTERAQKITTVQYGAFDECNSLESIEFPATLKIIDERAFYHSASLKYCKIHCTTRPTSSLDMFTYAHPEFEIRVPQSMVASYESTSYWNNYTIAGF